MNNEQWSMCNGQFELPLEMKVVLRGDEFALQASA
jgi:hypothetical protein